MKLSREQIVKSLENQGYPWVSLESGTSPYAPETILVFDKGINERLCLNDGRCQRPHDLVVLGRDLKFDGNAVAVKKLMDGWWTRPGYSSRGRDVTVYRIKVIFGDVAVPEDGYKIYREVADLQTVSNYEDQGAATLVLRGGAAYSTIYLVDATAQMPELSFE